MMNKMSTYTQPDITKTRFNCPNCGAFSHHHWLQVFVRKNPTATPYVSTVNEVESNGEEPSESEYRKIQQKNGWMHIDDIRATCDMRIDNCHFSFCISCNFICTWVHDKLVYPNPSSGFEPNTDLPEEIKIDFKEASAVLDKSPRSAAALLRLALEKLCSHLGAKGRNINEKIGDLVSKGLNPQIQQALDIVRVIGNNAVHPGSIDLKDNSETAASLFGLINLIADKMISEPKHIAQIYNNLPSGALKGILDRDNI